MFAVSTLAAVSICSELLDSEDISEGVTRGPWGSVSFDATDVELRQALVFRISGEVIADNVSSVLLIALWSEWRLLDFKESLSSKDISGYNALSWGSVLIDAILKGFEVLGGEVISEFITVNWGSVFIVGMNPIWGLANVSGISEGLTAVNWGSVLIDFKDGELGVAEISCCFEILISQGDNSVSCGSVLIVGLESDLWPAIGLYCSELLRREDISGTFGRDSVLTIAIGVSGISSFVVIDSERLVSGVEADKGLFEMSDDDDDGGAALMDEVLFTIWTKSWMSRDDFWMATVTLSS